MKPWRKEQETLSTFESKQEDKMTKSIEDETSGRSTAIGAAAVSIVSIALAMTVSFRLDASD